MISITMDPPHVVNTGVACAECFNIAPGQLLRCGDCNSAWYCNQKCQRKQYKEHKQFCCALRLFHSLQEDLPAELWPRTAHEFYVQRTNFQRIMEPMLRHPLSRAELRAILGEAKCSVCMRTRAQLAQVSSTTPISAALTTHGDTVTTTSATSASEQPSPVGTAKPTYAAPSDTVIESSTESASTKPPPSTSQTLALKPASAPGTTADGGRGSIRGDPLSCCSNCHWGWVCSEHREAYFAGPHTVVCMSYQQMNNSQLLTQRYLTATGRLPNYVPNKLRPTGQSYGGWEPVPAGWAAFQLWRPLPMLDGAMMCLLTKRMSQSLTVIQALQHHYSPQQLAGRRNLEVHVLGAASFEVPADRTWEELLNLLPPYLPPYDRQATAPATATAPSTSDVASSGALHMTATYATDTTAKSNVGGSMVDGRRVLHVAFVGPELRDIIVEESDGQALSQGTELSSPPPLPGREMLYSYHLCPYQEFVKGRHLGEVGGRGGIAGGGGEPKSECVWKPPDIAVAFNSGISEHDQKLWEPALEVLVRHGVPIVFTSYNEQEAAGDAALWRAAGGEVTLEPEENPFRASEPIPEPSQVDVFYHQNYYWWCGRGRR